MTDNEWIDQLVELEDTMGDPTDLSLRARQRQMWDRIREIEDYLAKGGREPRADWKLTVPDISEAAKEKLRAEAIAWFSSEMDEMKRDLAEMEAERRDSGHGDRGPRGTDHEA